MQIELSFSMKIPVEFLVPERYIESDPGGTGNNILILLEGWLAFQKK